MRFSNTVACFVACLVAPTTALNVFRPSALGSNDNLTVPGDSPLRFCDANRDEDLIVIQKVDLSPNPPKAGKTLDITASGEILSTITEGAYVKVSVKFGLIKLLTITADMCEQLGQVDLSCPLEPGKLTITKSVDLPGAIPPGTYTVNADVYAEDDRHITCLDATVKFTAGGFSLDMLGLNEEL